MASKTTLELLDYLMINNTNHLKSFLEKDDTDPCTAVNLGDAELSRSETLKLFFSDLNNTSVTPLHVAVIACYSDRTLLFGYPVPDWTNLAMRNLKDLLKRYVKINQECSMTLAGRLFSSHGDVRLESICPFDLAHYLLEEAPTCEQKDCLRQAIDLLEHHTKSQQERMVLVRASIVSAWHDLLFAESTSDVQFVCGDGVIVHAHKCILSTSTPFSNDTLKGLGT